MHFLCLRYRMHRAQKDLVVSQVPSSTLRPSWRPGENQKPFCSFPGLGSQSFFHLRRHQRHTCPRADLRGPCSVCPVSHDADLGLECSQVDFTHFRSYTYILPKLFDSFLSQQVCDGIPRNRTLSGPQLGGYTTRDTWRIFLTSCV